MKEVETLLTEEEKTKVNDAAKAAEEACQESDKEKINESIATLFEVQQIVVAAKSKKESSSGTSDDVAVDAEFKETA